MKTRTIALLLAFVMAVCCLTGCTSTRVRSYSEESSDASSDKYAAAMSAYKSNKKVMTIDGSPVYWNEYAYFLCAVMSNIERYGTQITDWSQVYDESTGKTYADLMTESVVNNIAWNHLVEIKAAENDVTFDAAGEQYVQDTIDQTIQNVVGDGGTESELNEKLKSYYMDLDLFKYFTKMQYLYNALASKLFGENGANITDEQVQEFAEENDYMTAKHILLKTTDDSGSALSDADKAAKKQQAEQIAAQVKAVTDPDKRVELFDQLMEQYNEDTGEASYPHGYCFPSGSMVTEFEDACKALEPYEVSGVVESQHGYHVILRMPTQGDDLVVSSDGSQQTLQMLVAQQQLSSLLTGWVDEAEVTWEPKFRSIDYAAVFTPKESFWKRLDVFDWFEK